MSDSNLFSPIQIGRITLDHRVVMAPLTRHRANKGHVHKDLAVEYYGQRASVSKIVYQAPLLVGATNHRYVRHLAPCSSRRQLSLHRKRVDTAIFPESGPKSK